MLVASWLCSSLISQLVGKAAVPEQRMVVVRDTMPVMSRGGGGGGNATLVVTFFNAETRACSRRREAALLFIPPR